MILLLWPETEKPINRSLSNRKNLVKLQHFSFIFSGPSSTSSRRSGGTGASGSGRSTADYYQLDKSSPYHHGGGRAGGKKIYKILVLEKIIGI